MLKSISFNYLIFLFIMNATWLFYAIKADLPDIFTINLIGTAGSLAYVLTYLYVKSTYQRSKEELNKFILCILYILVLSSPVVSKSLAGTLAMILNLATYVTILDSLKQTISTKDSKTINMIVTCAAGMSATSWMLYALII